MAFVSWLACMTADLWCTVRDIETDPFDNVSDDKDDEESPTLSIRVNLTQPPGGTLLRVCVQTPPLPPFME